MPAAITTLRSTLATDLTNAGVWSVFAFPPATLLANAVAITPGDPYIVPSNNDHVTVLPLAAVVTKLAASALTLNISSISAPAIVSAQSGDLLVSEITVSILTSWS